MAPKRKATKTKAQEGGDAAPAATKKSKSALAVGDNVSAVAAELTTEDGRQVTLAELTKDTGIVIFMYPKANTSGCTKQACAFRDGYQDIRALGYGVYGLSFDSPTSQGNWKEKYDLPYSLLTDKEGVAIKAFGAFKQPKNIARSHVVVKKGGELADIQNGISSGDSFDVALETVKNLK